HLTGACAQPVGPGQAVSKLCDLIGANRGADAPDRSHDRKVGQSGAATPDRVRCIDLAGLSPYQFVVVMHSAMKSDPAGLPKILCHDTAQLIAIPADGMRTGGKLDMGLVTGIS